MTIVNGDLEFQTLVFGATPICPYDGLHMTCTEWTEARATQTTIPSVFWCQCGFKVAAPTIACLVLERSELE